MDFREVLTLKEESVVGIPGRVLLRLEKSIKVPKGALLLVGISENLKQRVYLHIHVA